MEEHSRKEVIITYLFLSLSLVLFGYIIEDFRLIDMLYEMFIEEFNMILFDHHK